jgi:carboxymethylenebutenolidase
MCDDTTDRDLDAIGAFTRRDFAMIAGSLGLVAAFPANAATRKVIERDVLVPTPDGKADCYFVAPAKGKHAAVIMWTDVYGLRPAFRQMGKRLAEAGYAVLVMNPFYRSAKAPIIAPNDPRNEETRKVIAPMRALMTPDAITRDAKAFVAFLDTQKSVSKKRKIGTIGYCMGGPLVVRTAAAVPERIGAVGSFHGGGLVTTQPDSPHLLIPQTKAGFLIAIADNDDKQAPEDKAKLRAAFDAANRDAEIEVYAGAMHGWCPPDGRAYHPVQAEKAWSRLLALFAKTLG